MSLTDWVYWDSHLIDSLFPNKPRLTVKSPIKAPQLTTHYSTVGTAFDYALRFLIAQQQHLATHRSWVADHAAKNKRCKTFLSTMEEKLTSLVFNNEPNIKDMLPDFITLAKMDGVYRCGMNIPNAELFDVDKADVQDLTNLVDATDMRQFRCNHQCQLNPTFGNSSPDVGGADADLILDDKLIDIKTIKHLEFDRDTFRQLVGYYLLNLREDNLYGEIKQLGVYYSRFGVMFTFPAPEPQLRNYLTEMTPTDIQTMSHQEYLYWLNTVVSNAIHDYQDEVLSDTIPREALRANHKDYKWDVDSHVVALETDMELRLGHRFESTSINQVNTVLHELRILPTRTITALTNFDQLPNMPRHPFVDLLIERHALTPLLASIETKCTRGAK